MPIFVYACEKCLAERELLEKVRRDPPPDCLECGCPTAPVIRSGASRGFTLRGDGWAADGYASKKKKEGAS